MSEIALPVNPSEYGIEEKKANELLSNLPQIISERSVLEPQYNEIIQMDIELPETAKRAAELRKLIKNNRTKGIEVWHKAAKDYFLKGGQFVDAIKRKEIAVNEFMENKLEEIEKYQENKIAKAKAKLKADREAELGQYCETVSLFPLGEMSEEAYQQLLNGQKLAHEAKIEAERKEAEAKAEQERKERVLRERHLELARYAQFINLDELTLETTQEDYERLLNIALGNKAEYEAKQAEIAAKNERLRKEAAAKEQLRATRSKLLQPYIAFIRDYNALIDLPENEFEAQFTDIKKGAELQWAEEAKQAKIKADEAAAEKKRLEDAENDRKRLQKELDDKKAAEEKAEADRLAAIEAELSKGDAEKIEDFKADLEALRTKYQFRSAKYKKIYSEASELLNRTINFIISNQ